MNIMYICLNEFPLPLEARERLTVLLSLSLGPSYYHATHTFAQLKKLNVFLKFGIYGMIPIMRNSSFCIC